MQFNRKNTLSKQVHRERERININCITVVRCVRYAAKILAARSGQETKKKKHLYTVYVKIKIKEKTCVLVNQKK